MNIAICWISPPREHSVRPRNVPIRAIDVRMTWLYQCVQEERDPSLMSETVYSSRICGNVGTLADLIEDCCENGDVSSFIEELVEKCEEATE